MKFCAALIILFILNNCTTGRYKSERSNDSYNITEYLKEADCSIYSMKFKQESDVILRISTSGKCLLLNKSQFLNAFEMALKEVENYSFSQNKSIILEFPSVLDISNEEILVITKESTTILNLGLEKSTNKGFDIVNLKFNN